MLFLRLYISGHLYGRNLLGRMALSVWVVSLSLRVFAPLHRCLVDDQLFWLCGAQCDRLVLLTLTTTQLYPTMLQPVLFGELVIMLWLLIKGANVPPRAPRSRDEDGMNMIDNSQRTAAKVAG